MTGMPTSDATWIVAAASFLGMWIAMTVAMMLPSVAPRLWRYRRDVAAAGAARPNRLVLLAVAGYLGVWAAIGVVVLPLGVARQALWHPGPLALFAVVLLAGALQCTAWKTHAPDRCVASDANVSARGEAVSAWRHGLALGRRCAISCAAPMVALLAAGVMDVRVMAAMAAAIALGRFAPGLYARLTRPDRPRHDSRGASGRPRVRAKGRVHPESTVW